MPFPVAAALTAVTSIGMPWLNEYFGAKAAKTELKSQQVQVATQQQEQARQMALAIRAAEAEQARKRESFTKIAVTGVYIAAGGLAVYVLYRAVRRK